MKSAYISDKHKCFYQNLKKSLQKKNNWLFGSKNRTTDLVVLDVTKDVELFKIVTPDDVENVKVWVEKLKKIYVLAWYRASYTLVYVDDDFNELERKTFPLK